MELVSQRLGEQYPKTDKGWSVLITDYKQQRVGSNSRALSLMFGSTALLLLILCANIAGLLLGQMQQRERELAIRASLGATRGQVAGVILREVAILACLSGALGLGLGFLGSRLLAGLFADLLRIQELVFAWPVALFTIGATALAALVFGLIPSIQAMRRDLNAALARGGRAQAGGRRRLQQILVSAQFAVTLVLLAGAGLLLRTYYNLTRVQPGFRAAQVITFHVGAEWGEDRIKVGLLQQQVVAELEQLPGVEAAGMTNFLPAAGATLRTLVSVQGLPEAGDRGRITAGGRMVSGGYLRALNIPLLAGSICPDAGPDWKRQAKVLVNRRLVEVAGGVDLVGRILTPHDGGGGAGEIIGVVGDIREDALNAPPVPYVYSCTAPGAWPDPEYVVAVTRGSRDMVTAIREVLRRIAPQRAVFGVSTLSEHLDRTLDRPRLNAGVLGVFAGSALLSAALGLYGLVMLMVTARTREIGLRMALGATRARIVMQVAREALRPLGAAIVIGVTLAALVLRAFRSILFEIAPADLLVFSCVCGLLIAVALAAALIPGFRAARIDPMQALRSE